MSSPYDVIKLHKLITHVAIYMFDITSGYRYQNILQDILYALKPTRVMSVYLHGTGQDNLFSMDHFTHPCSNLTSSFRLSSREALSYLCILINGSIMHFYILDLTLQMCATYQAVNQSGTPPYTNNLKRSKLSLIYISTNCISCKIHEL